MNVAVCVPWVPMRIVFDSAATPRLPISTLLFPWSSLTPASITECDVIAPGRVGFHRADPNGGVGLPRGVT